MAVTSANISGGQSPLTAEEVHVQLNGRIPLIIAGGRTPGGIPSTVVDCSTNELKIFGKVQYPPQTYYRHYEHQSSPPHTLRIGLITDGKTLILLSGFVQVTFKRPNIITSAFSYQTAYGSGKPEAVWVFNEKNITGI